MERCVSCISLQLVCISSLQNNSHPQNSPADSQHYEFGGS